MYPELHYMSLIFTPIWNAVILTKMSLLLRPITTVMDYNSSDCDSSDISMKSYMK